MLGYAQVRKGKAGQERLQDFLLFVAFVAIGRGYVSSNRVGAASSACLYLKLSASYSLLDGDLNSAAAPHAALG
jgi:hypothetical protein